MNPGVQLAYRNYSDEMKKVIQKTQRLKFHSKSDVPFISC